MNRQTVHKTTKGKATYQWGSGTQIRYLIEFADGRTLWTNSMDIVRKELKEDKQTKMDLR